MAKHERGLRFQPAGGTRATQIPTGKKQRLTIERLANDGRGIAFFEGKTWFVAGSLAGEEVEARVLNAHGKIVEARTERVFQGKLFSVGHVLHAATTATTEVRTRRRTTHGAALEHTLSTRFHDFAVGIEHSGFDFFACTAARNEPRLAFKKRDAPPVVCQALDRQSLFLAGRDLVGPGAACWLEAQASFMFGHQLGAS